MALEAAGKTYGELADGDVPDVQRERVECVDSVQNNGIQRERGGDLLIRVFQTCPTRPSTRTTTRPQLDPNLTRVGAEVGASCLNANFVNSV